MMLVLRGVLGRFRVEPRLRRCLAALFGCLILSAQTGVLATQRDAAGVIRVGVISTLTGVTPFRESSDAVKAYFDTINANGGIRGRRLELVVADDGGDPERARLAAQQMIADPRVMALVGGASVVDCSVNGKAYEQAGMIVLQGTGIEPACFASSHIVPLNSGPFLATRNALQFARDTLRANRICTLVFDIPNIPGMTQTIQESVEKWTKKTGVQLAHSIIFGPGDDVDRLVKRAILNRCDAVVHTGVEPLVTLPLKSGVLSPC